MDSSSVPLALGSCSNPREQLVHALRGRGSGGANREESAALKAQAGDCSKDCWRLFHDTFQSNTKLCALFSAIFRYIFRVVSSATINRLVLRSPKGRPRRLFNCFLASRSPESCWRRRHQGAVLSHSAVSALLSLPDKTPRQGPPYSLYHRAQLRAKCA